MHHLLIALGSEPELQTELLHAANVNGVSQLEVQNLLGAPAKLAEYFAAWCEACDDISRSMSGKIDES